MELSSGMSAQERVGWQAEVRLAELMGQISCLTAQVVDVIAGVLDAGAWAPGGGLRSAEHWVAWRTGVAPARAAALVAMARRQGELPECGALFGSGSLTEDAMKVIAAKAPGGRDHELAGLAPVLMHTQLRRVLAAIEDHNSALLGISPLEPTVNPRLRALIEARDQGCRYPGCSQRRWVQVHHLTHREDGGLTVAANLTNP